MGSAPAVYFAPRRRRRRRFLGDLGAMSGFLASPEELADPEERRRRRRRRLAEPRPRRRREGLEGLAVGAFVAGLGVGLGF